MSLVTGEQLRAARAMLRMEQESLAERAGVSVATIRRMEGFDGPIGARTDTLRRLQHTLEAAGVEFLDGAQPGATRRLEALRRLLDDLGTAAHAFGQNDQVGAEAAMLAVIYACERLDCR